MKQIPRLLIASLATGGAFAAPVIRPETAGSAIIFWASNPGEQAYKCSLAYTWSYDAAGERKVTDANASFDVPSNASNIEVARLEGSYPNLALDKWTLACN